MKKKIGLVLLLLIGIAVTGFFSTNIVKAEVNNGKYSIEYLLKNYNVVTLGQKTNNFIDYYKNNNYYQTAGKGNITNVTNIDGAVLVQGNYTSQNNATFGTTAGSVKSFIKGTKGNNVETPSELSTDSSYVDFEEMYVQVVNEQQMLIDKTKKNIMGPDIEITSPGIYTINNAAINEHEANAENTGTVYSGTNRLFIKNYDKNELYIFNSFDEYKFINSKNIVIIEKNSPSSTNLQDLVNSGNYTGNIIFNFPKAKLVFIISSNYNDYSGGSIIAPKADVVLNTYNYYGNIICNSIINNNNGTKSIRKANYTVNKSLVDNNSNKYLDEYKDYSDDYYSGSYSLCELLQNYSLVTLGKKNLESKTQLAQKGQNTGTVRLFHAAGPVLINGDLYGKISEVPTNGGYQTYETTRLDLESNTVTESYIKGNVSLTVRNGNGNSYSTSRAFVQNWENIDQSRKNYYGKKNLLFVGTNNFYYENTLPTNNYINFDRLYDKVVAQQQKIEEGTKIKAGEDGIAHIKVGGNYTIEDISKVKEIVFDNFDENKNKLTIITVKNGGDINFPLISRDNGAYKGVVTNDYYNKTEVTHPYEINNLVSDSYHGNIVWNVPNATYIKLKENAPFAGHLVAPKADVETPELHFAGAFIVNSLYAEGNTEAHFYPLTIKPDCDCNEYRNLNDTMKIKFSNYRLAQLLGADDASLEKDVLGDETQYRKDKETLEYVISKCPSNNTSNPITNILNNPLTHRNIGIVLLVIIVISGSLIITRKKTEKE